MSEVTRLLRAADTGDLVASEQLLPLVYAELRRLARARLADERDARTLQPTALVHEAYLRLVGGDGGGRWSGRGHFFAAAAEAMRRILIEHARRRNALRHGGGRRRVELPDGEGPAAVAGFDLDEVLALDEALRKLAAVDPPKVELVKLLYFAGMNLDEAAAALGIGRSTAHRHWQFARAWLHRELSGSPKPASDEPAP